MPLRDDLLTPVAGDNPAGANLRYDRVYDQIKEARTEDDDTLPLGAWERAPKRADHALVIKLAGEALATRSKDLQLAAWLTEAHIRREGIPLVDPCLHLLLDLQQQFWDNLYPEIEDGDAGMRAVPIEWAANRAATILREAPITRDGLSFYQYRESRTVGYEADAADSDAKRQAREQAVNDGKVTAEDFDKSFASTPKTYYAALDAAVRSSLQTLDSLQTFCDEKYGDDGPGFGKFRTALEEVGQVIGSLLNEKRKLEPDAAPEEAASEEAAAEPDAAESLIEQPESSPAQPRKKPLKAASAELADADDALARIAACSAFLQKDRPSSPTAYLVQASLRLGEMREQGSWASYDFLVAPSTEVRQQLKRLAAESSWEELLSTAIAALGEPCGRAWLDVHRYIWKAASESGYSIVAAAVISTLQGVLKDIPELITWTLNDDTPTANPETQKWLEDMVVAKAAESEPQPAQTEFIASPAGAGHGDGSEDGAPDLLDVARDFIRRGQLPQAIQLLMRDAAQQPSGRARFQRRLQVAQLCVSSGQSRVAFPVLEELVREIEERRLEEWEDSGMIAPPLALLLQCLDAAGNTTMREALFSRLCRIDPLAAMNVSQ